MSALFTWGFPRFRGTDGGAAGPLIKFFKQNGCIVIHKCERPLLAYMGGGFRWEAEVLTPCCFR